MQFSQMLGKLKAEQWRTLSHVLHVGLFEAWRVGDTIPDGDLPRGGRNTKIYAYQQTMARTVCRDRRRVHVDQGGDEDWMPQLDDCASSRNLPDYYKNIMCYLVALRILFNYAINRRDLEFAQQLLWRVATTFTRMNVNLTPSFHYMMHVEEHVLRFGSLYGTWTNAFERANRVLINTNNNGHGSGALEATMARGFLKRADCFRLVRNLIISLFESSVDFSTVRSNGCKPSLTHHVTIYRRSMQCLSSCAMAQNMRGNEECSLRFYGERLAFWDKVCIILCPSFLL